MTLYAQRLKNLVSGISQQPPLLRLPEQLSEQLNGYSSETSGLQKRSPTVFIKALMDSIAETAEPLVHFINRDSQERYIVYFYNGDIKVFDLQGNEKTVHIQEDADYVNTKTPREDLRVITVADYTFITNKTKTVAMSGTRSPNSFETQGCLINVKQGQYGRWYKIFHNGNQIAYDRPANGNSAWNTGTIGTNIIVDRLAYTEVHDDDDTSSDPLKNHGYTADTGSSWLRIQNVKASEITTTDDFNNNAMIVVGTAVNKFSDLPVSAPDGYTVKVKNNTDSNESASSYYVKYNASLKVWEECVAPNLPTTIEASTMPHILVRNSDGSFTFKRATWDTRQCGDDDSNPLPSFIGKTIRDVFFFRNRLGFLAGENIILSESASYFNFWMSTANDVLDTDVIDVSTTTNRINILNYAVPFNESLYLFSNSTQFLLSTDTTLSPKNVALVETTSFESDDTCRPVVAGKNMYFSKKRAEYTTIREYYNVQQVSDVKNAQDITSHVPSYIPNGVYAIVSQSNENIMLFLTEGDEECLYVYKYLFQNEQRVQASWSKWNLHGHIFGAFFVDSDLYICINHGGKHCLEKLAFTYNTLDYEGEEPYRVFLDSKKVATTGTYDDVNETTTFNLKNEWGLSDISDMTAVGLVAMDGSYFLLSKSEFTGDTVVIDGDYTKQKVIIGIPYKFKATLSPIYLRSTNAYTGTTKAVTNGRLQIRDVRIDYADTGAFYVHVKTQHNTKTYTYTLTQKQLHQYVLADTQQFATGTFRVPVQHLNTSCEIWIESDMPLPLSLIGLMWVGNFVQKFANGG